MCGILGQLRLHGNASINEKLFIDALNLQVHRGPDDADVYIVNDLGIAFGHRRLSIIDVASHSKQPMVSECGNYILIFNGEIYNYHELRNDLLIKGYVFRTNSDTEVLLNSFIEYGISCIQKFIGMFAFAIYNKRDNETYVVRDRLGVKPLYYFNDSKSFFFASEVKSILKVSQINKELNLNAVSSYLSFRFPILDDTFFNDILSLPPAHYIHIKDGSLNIKEYWNVANKFLEQSIDKGEEYYINELRRILTSAVKYRMISDVPVGAFLSGGVDSSIITALMSTMSTNSVKTFTIGFIENGYNEFEYARIIADKYKTIHKEIVLSGEDYIEVMNDLISFKDAPLSVPNEVPLFLMSKELSKDITVVLSGEGADEIFGGYGRIFRSPYDFERIRSIDDLDYNDDEKEALILNFVKKYAVQSFDSEISHFMSLYSYTGLEDKKKFLNSTIDLESIENKFVAKFMSYFNELSTSSYYNKMMYAFEKVHLVGLLQRVDITTMAASVEARVPFVDHRLVEFAFTVPFKYKLKWSSDDAMGKAKFLMSDAISEKLDAPKYLLKKAFEDMIPREVLYRNKVGFPVPLNCWFGGAFNDYARKILLSDVAMSRGLYNINNINVLLNNKDLLRSHSTAMKLWMLINLEIFLRKYF